MAKKTINLGTGPNAKNGDKTRVAFQKVNENFDEVYPAVEAADAKAGTATTAASTAESKAVAAAAAAAAAQGAADTAAGLASTASAAAAGASSAAGAANTKADAANTKAESAVAQAGAAAGAANAAAAVAASAREVAELALDKAEDALANGGTGGGGGSIPVAQPMRVVTASTTLSAADVANGGLVGAAPEEIVVGVPDGLPAGEIEIVQGGQGRVRPETIGAFNIRVSPGKLLATSGLYSSIQLRRAADGQYYATGDLATLTAPQVVPASFSLAENLPAGTVIGTVQTIGGFPSAFRILSGNTGDAVSIDSAGTLRTAKSLDFETLATYALVVEAENTLGKHSAAIAFTVQDVLELPVVQVGQSFFVNEAAAPGAPIGMLMASNAPTSWTLSGPGAAYLNVSSAGQLTLKGVVDMETATALQFGVVATNSIGPSGDPVSATLNIIVEAPAGPTDIFFVSEIVGEETAIPAGTVGTFGLLFKKGMLPSGDTATMRLMSNDSPLITQMDVLTRYDDTGEDNSVKVALFAFESPAVPIGTRIPFKMVRNAPHPAPGANLSLATFMTSRTAAINVGAQAFNLKTSIPTERLRNGPLVTHARVQASINAVEMGGSTGGLLFADLIGYKDGAMEADAAVGNILAMNAGTSQPTTVAGVTITLDGAQKYSSGSFALWRYQRLVRRAFSVVGGGAVPARPTIRPPVEFLATVGLIPPLDVTYGVDASIINAAVAQLTSTGWNTPMNQRGISKTLGAQGGNADIGPVPRSVAAWLMTGDYRMTRHVHDTGEAANGIPWHNWIMSNANPSEQTGNWINRTEQGDMWIDYRDPGLGTGGKYGPNHDNASGWTLSEKSSHIPDYVGVVGILTARMSLIDSLAASATWGIMQQLNERSARGKTTVTRYTDGEGVNVIRSNQLRGGAWLMRQIYLAGISLPRNRMPATETYLPDVVRGNLNWLLGRRAPWQAEAGETHGYVQDVVYGYPDTLSMWQQDYFNTTMNRLMANGDTATAEYQAWALNFNAGRFIQDGANFWPSNGIRNIWTYRNSGSVRFTTWRQIQDDMGGSSHGAEPSTFSTIDGDYGLWALAAMAHMRSLFPQDARMARAWGWLINQTTIPFATATGLRNSTSLPLNVMPIGQTRASVPPVVVPGQNYPLNKELPVGTVVGVVQTTGGGATAFRFRGASVGENRFRVEQRSGCIVINQSLVGSGATSFALDIEVESRFSPVKGGAMVTLGAVAVSPEIVPGQVFTASESLAVGQSIGDIQTTGATVVGFEILSGNTGGAWNLMTPPGKVTLATGPLDDGVIAAYTLSVRPLGLSNNGTPQNITINVVPFVAAPVITPGQSFTVPNAATVGTVVGQLAITGGTPATVTITAGNTGGTFAVSNAGQITVAVVPNGNTTPNYSLTFAAQNGGGTSTVAAAVSVTMPQVGAPALILNAMPSTDIRAAYSLQRIGNYTGPVVQGEKASNAATMDFGTTADGNLDWQAVEAFAAGGRVNMGIWYDQGPLGQNMIRFNDPQRARLTDDAGKVMLLPGSTIPRHAVRFPGDGHGMQRFGFETGGLTSFGGLAAMTVSQTIDDGRIWSLATFNSQEDFNLSNGQAFITETDTTLRNMRGFDVTSPGVGYTVGQATAAGAIYEAGTRKIRKDLVETTYGTFTAAVPGTSILRLGIRLMNNSSLSGRWFASTMLFFSISNVTDRNAAAQWMKDTYGF
jgi:hypothetical protein